MKEIPIGTSLLVEKKTTPEMSAKSVGSGDLNVFSTPEMTAMMEEASWKAIAPFLDENESSVGVVLNVEHISATPIGMNVSVRSSVTSIDKRKITFNVTANDDTGEIGRGIHERFVVSKDRFMEKTLSKQPKPGKND